MNCNSEAFVVRQSSKTETIKETQIKEDSTIEVSHFEEPNED